MNDFESQFKGFICYSILKKLFLISLTLSLHFIGTVPLFGKEEIKKIVTKEGEQNKGTLSIGSQIFPISTNQKLDPIDSNNALIHQVDGYTKDHYLNLGTNSSSQFSINGLQINERQGEVSGMNFYDRSNYKSLSSSKLWDVKTPYTYLHYSQGPNEFQYFKGIYSVNLKKNLNFTLSHQKLSNDGGYYNQATTQRSTDINLWYKSLSKKYVMIGSLIFNRYLQNENGGTADPSYFEKYGVLNGPVNLTTASTSYRNRNYLLDQYFFLGKNDTISALKDTLRLKYKINTQKIFIQFKNNAFWERMEMKDTLSDFKYFPLTNDTLKTRERNLFQKLSSDVLIGYKIQDSSNLFILKGGISQEFNQYLTSNQKLTSNNTLLIGNMIYQKVSKLELSGNGNFVLQGYNQGNFALSGGIKYFLSDSNILSGGADFSYYLPEKMFTFIIGNHFFWNNTFNPQNKLNLHLKYESLKYKLSLNIHYQTITNYLYFNQLLKPIQSELNINLLGLRINHLLHFGIFHFKNDLVLQSILSGKEYYPLPTLSYRGNPYLEFMMFKKALKFRTGVDYRFTTIFTPLTYIPELQQFSTVNSGKVGNYHFIDYWINLEIKTFNLYFTFENLASNVSPYKYYSLSNYPIPPTSFLRLGVQWRFRN